MSGQIIVGDAVQTMRTLKPQSIDMVLTSPPYYRLRDYGIVGQLGDEQVVGDWVDGLRHVAREVARVLVPTGSLWLNLGDTYAVHPRQGAGRKSLLLGPERLALALIADGWLLRNKIVWQKANPMPTSVSDRLACTWEVIYVFTRSPRYFFDLDAIRVPHRSPASKRRRTTALVRGRESWRGSNSAGVSGLDRLKSEGMVGHPLGKNPGDVWTTASSNYRGSHRATFPTTLVERAVRTGCPEMRCSACQTPHHRTLIRSIGGTAVQGALAPQCACNGGAEPGLVLDPFIGSGTTGLVAETLGRDWLGIELNPAFATEAGGRIAGARPPLRAA